MARPGSPADPLTTVGLIQSDLQAVTTTATAQGDAPLVTPAADEKLEVQWVSAQTDPDEAATPLVRVKLGAAELYRAFAISHRETFVGQPGAALTVNLEHAGSVAITVHYRRVPV